MRQLNMVFHLYVGLNGVCIYIYIIYMSIYTPYIYIYFWCCLQGSEGWIWTFSHFHFLFFVLDGCRGSRALNRKVSFYRSKGCVFALFLVVFAGVWRLRARRRSLRRFCRRPCGVRTRRTGVGATKYAGRRTASASKTVRTDDDGFCCFVSFVWSFLHFFLVFKRIPGKLTC